MYFFLSPLITSAVALIAIVLSLVLSIFVYAKIFITMQEHQAQVHVHHNVPQVQSNGEGIARDKKTVSSIAWVQRALIACYGPFIVCL